MSRRAERKQRKDLRRRGLTPDGVLNEERGTYTTGTGQILVGVHDREDCLHRACAIHGPSEHQMRGFPTHFRFDRGLMERVCPHGVGHPDPDDLRYQVLARPDSMPGVHGCDGCCR